MCRFFKELVSTFVSAGDNKLVLFFECLSWFEEQLAVVFLKFSIILTVTSISYVPLYKVRTCFAKKLQVSGKLLTACKKKQQEVRVNLPSFIWRLQLHMLWLVTLT